MSVPMASQGQFPDARRVTIRRETPADGAAIEAVVRRAFNDGASSGGQEAALVAAIRRAPGFDPELSLVATVDGAVAGHLLFSPCEIRGATAATSALALAPLAVLPGFERLRLGTRLMREGLWRCRDRGHQIVIVLGHARYYSRFGFRPANDFGIHPPWQVAPANFQVLALVPGALDGVTGVVHYPPAFDAV